MFGYKEEDNIECCDELRKIIKDAGLKIYDGEVYAQEGHRRAEISVVWADYFQRQRELREKQEKKAEKERAKKLKEVQSEYDFCVEGELVGYLDNNYGFDEFGYDCRDVTYSMYARLISCDGHFNEVYVRQHRFKFLKPVGDK